MRVTKDLAALFCHRSANADMPGGFRRVALILTSMLAGTLALQAQEATNSQQNAAATAFKQDFLWASAQTNRLRLGAYADYSYVAPGVVKYPGANGNKSDAQTVNLALSAEVPINKEWFVPVVVGAESLFFNQVDDTPIPDRVNVIRLNAGVGYRFGENWTVSASAGPLLYRVNNIEGEDVGVGGMVRATYRLNPDVIFNFGWVFNPDSDVPVLPMFGARWSVRTNLTLNLMFPRTGIVYQAAPKLSTFVGVGLGGATFRTDESFGNGIGQPRFNNQLATYWDIRAGIGVEYALSRAVAVSLEGGYSVWRELDYKDLDEKVRFMPSPCVQAGIRCRF
jgi:hypothetical protein